MWRGPSPVARLGHGTRGGRLCRNGRLGPRSPPPGPSGRSAGGASGGRLAARSVAAGVGRPSGSLPESASRRASQPPGPCGCSDACPPRAADGHNPPAWTDRRSILRTRCSGLRLVSGAVDRRRLDRPLWPMPGATKRGARAVAWASQAPGSVVVTDCLAALVRPARRLRVRLTLVVRLVPSHRPEPTRPRPMVGGFWPAGQLHH